MNIFQLTYENRLLEWNELRKYLSIAPLETQCVEIDKWWQQAPLVNHYLHPDDVETWPSPWELLVDNNYCVHARGLGMYYTLVLLGVSDVDFFLAKDHNNEDVSLVSVMDAKYLLNYYPNTVITNSLNDFKTIKKLSVNKLQRKLK